MQTTSGALNGAILGAWEQADGQSATARALTLLAAADLGQSDEQLGLLSAGARNRRLLELRARLFGPLMSCVVDCPECSEQLEFELNVAELLQGQVDGDTVPNTQTVHEAWDDDLHLTFRLPGTRELSAVSVLGGVPEAVQSLRCASLLQAELSGSPLALDTCPERVWALLDRELDALDPQAHLELNLSCPACGFAWSAGFDVGTYLWTEVRTWGEGVLLDVHELALAYGWPESDILSLSPTRRQRYLDLLRG